MSLSCSAIICVFLVITTTCVVQCQQVLQNPSFEQGGNFSWQPFLSGFFVESSGHARTGESCVSLTPHHFFGVWQHVTFEESWPKASSLTLSGWANCEWGYGSRASISAVITYDDGSVGTVGLSFQMGTMDYQRRCRVLRVPEGRSPVSATVFGIASPLSSSYGTVFLDDFTLTLDAPASDCSEDVEPPLTPHDAPVLIKPIGQDDTVIDDSKGLICAVVTMSHTDVAYAAELMSIWKGPIVFSVTGWPKDAAAGESQMPKGDDRIRIIPFADPLTPLGVLRSWGERLCPSSSRVLHLEAPLLPSAQLEGTLSTLASRKPSAALVVAAFSVPQDSASPVADKDSLLKLRHAPFASLPHPLAQYSTNLTRWILSQEPYAVEPIVEGPAVVGLTWRMQPPEESDTPEAPMFNRHYAPVLCVARGALHYDSKLLHRSHQVASAVMELWLQGVTFLVVPQEFVAGRVLGQAQATDSSDVKQLTTEEVYRVWRAYYVFLGHLMERYSAQHMVHTLRAVPFADPTRDHRFDPPFWRRLLLVCATLVVAGFILRLLLQVETPGHGAPSAMWNPLLRSSVKEL